MVLISKAARIAAEAHGSIGQLRKYSATPYVEHPARVAELVASVTTDRDMVAAAWLHDVVEDVCPVNSNYSLDYLTHELNPRVAKLVEELTDVYTKKAYPSLNRKKRHALECVRLLNVSPEAQTIKLADILDNGRDIAVHDEKFAKVSLEETRELLPSLAQGDKVLYARACKLVAGHLKN